jgi:tRNA threonylcarbamoyladenosine biosynthesis protein TsaE
MAPADEIQILSGSPEETEKLAEEIGKKVRGGEVIELISDLGGGKTIFVYGLAKGMGSSAKVASPSFTIENEYKAGELTLCHFDFYRLTDAGIVKIELEEKILDKKMVTVIEWSDIVKDALPSDRLSIKINAKSETTREFIFSCPESLNYLIK